MVMDRIFFPVAHEKTCLREMISQMHAQWQPISRMEERRLESAGRGTARDVGLVAAERS